MQRLFSGPVVVVVVFSLLGACAPAQAADDYTVDPVHTSVYFKISHLGLTSVFGRFNDFSGNFTIDPDDAGKCSFALNIKVESIDTNNKQRDTHLRSPDFFNAKQFPAITFKSTAVAAVPNGYKVTGDLTMHGVSKSVDLELVGGGKAEFPPGVPRTGFSMERTIKRSDFGVGAEQFAKLLGDEVRIAIGLEGTRR